MPVVSKRFIVLCIVVFAAMSLAYAQPKASGASFSISGAGIMYEHYIDNDCFINADLRAELLAVFMNRNNSPGISASVSCNFILKNWTTENYGTISIFAGPGVMLGMSPDFRKENGGFFGLKGKIGAECRFDRNITVSLSLNPVVGSHIIIKDEHIEMKNYRNGLLNAAIPEIAIKYSF